MSEYPKSKENRAKLAHAMVQLFSPDAKPDEEREDAVIEEMTKRVCNEFRQMHKVTWIGLAGCITEEDFHKYIMEQHDREVDEWEEHRDLLKELTDGVDEFLADPTTARMRVIEVSPVVHSARMAAFKATCTDSALSADEDDETPVKAGMVFSLSASETAKARAWEREQTKKDDKPATIGGRFQYRITPTSVGLVVKVYDTLLQEEIEVTEYENW